MSEKITRFVNKNFDTDLGPKLNLKGINRVNVIFKIDKQGNIIDVQSRAPHPKLEEEAERVINALPQMQPGKQRGKPYRFLMPFLLFFRYRINAKPGKKKPVGAFLPAGFCF
ncbi:energy transducer TonB [Antarcticibacterium sp. 1MA-6-2]|uniref:energy transducer TonB n=1 Tax=Antarcticibacterium sp. 1MA-6-2 TaxID=2908210 RepID=UPI002882E642|nr:energy transducer TonB [Antarcticibacterium sp. 1MA-6-2]